MHVLLNLSLKIIAKPFLIDVLILGFTSKSSTVFIRLTLHFVEFGICANVKLNLIFTPEVVFRNINSEVSLLFM